MEVTECAKGDVVYSYEKWDAKKVDLTPCAYRD
jgi:hypothetical protein